MASMQPIIDGSGKFPKPKDQSFQYGTAGVRLTTNLAYSLLTGLTVPHESVGILL